MEHGMGWFILKLKFDFDVIELIECTCMFSVFFIKLFTNHSRWSQQRKSQTEPLSLSAVSTVSDWSSITMLIACSVHGKDWLMEQPWHNYYSILDLRDRVATPTGQQIGQFSPKWVKYPHHHPFVCLFLPHPQESSLLSTNQRQCSLNWANIPRTCWAKRFGPWI